MGRKPKEAVEAMSNSLNEMRREFESDFLGVRAHEEAYSEAMDIAEHRPPINKYKREIKKGVYVDIYDILKCFNVTNPAIQHAIKKLLAGGQRGYKDIEQDYHEAIASTYRAIELETA